MSNYDVSKILEELTKLVNEIKNDAIMDQKEMKKESHAAFDKKLTNYYNFKGMCKIDQLPAKADYLDAYCLTNICDAHPSHIKDYYGNDITGGDCVFWTGFGWHLISKDIGKMPVNYCEDTKNEIDTQLDDKKEYILTMYKNEVFVDDVCVRYKLSDKDALEILRIITNKEYPVCKFESVDGSLVYDKKLEN